MFTNSTKKKGVVDKFIFNNLTDYPIDLSYKYNLTPNVLTTISFVLQYSSVQLLYLNYRISYFILYLQDTTLIVLMDLRQEGTIWLQHLEISMTIQQTYFVIFYQLTIT